MSVEAVWETAAYFAALLIRLAENKDDQESDLEIVEMLTAHPWLVNLIVPVLQSVKSVPTPAPAA